MCRFTKVAMAVAIAVSAALSALPSMAAVTTNIRVPIAMTLTNPCNGDQMSQVGTFHALAVTTVDAAGIHTEVHLNELQARDTDLTTGVECVDTGNLNESGLNIIFNLPPGPGTPTGDFPLIATVVAQGNISCPGTGGSDTFQLLIHITVKPDGTIAVFLDNSPGQIKCH
jgi:hypothetical protein